MHGSMPLACPSLANTFLSYHCPTFIFSHLQHICRLRFTKRVVLLLLYVTLRHNMSNITFMCANKHISHHTLERARGRYVRHRCERGLRRPRLRCPRAHAGDLAEREMTLAVPSLLRSLAVSYVPSRQNVARARRVVSKRDAAHVRLSTRRRGGTQVRDLPPALHEPNVHTVPLPWVWVLPLHRPEWLQAGRATMLVCQQLPN